MSYDKTAQGKGREYIKDRQAILTEVVEAGRTVRQCGREWLAGRRGVTTEFIVTDNRQRNESAEKGETI